MTQTWISIVNNFNLIGSKSPNVLDGGIKLMVDKTQ